MGKRLSLPVPFEAEIKGELVRFTGLNAKNICHYSATARELTGNQHTKPLKFLAEDCIQYLPDSKTFLCEHLPDYNVTDYHMTQTGTDVFDKPVFECNCQFFQTHKKLGHPRTCAHILSLILWFKSGKKRFKNDTNISGTGGKNV